MNTQFHGLVSLVLVAAAVLISALVLLQSHPAMGVYYLVGVSLAVLAILGIFCSKCPCRDSCGHVIPGKLLQIANVSRNSPYTNADLALTAMALTFMLVLPQAWLWRHLTGLLTFWILLVAALVQIRLRVCRVCKNTLCPGNKHFRP